MGSLSRRSGAAPRSPRRQRGIVAVLVTAGLIAILAMVGLGIDTGHLMSGKARLQAAVDAAALAGAKELDQTGNAGRAEATARAALSANAEDRYHDLTEAGVTVEFSNSVQTFTPGSEPARYIRVTASNYSMWSSFTALVGIDQLSVSASAVAGPSPAVAEACNIVPMMVCGDPGQADDFGFEPDSIRMLAIGGDMPSPIGPGNFQLLRLPDENGQVQNGAADVRENLAGRTSACAAVGTPLEIETQPGALVGPLERGLNTRFGRRLPGNTDPALYPSDVITEAADPVLTTSSSGLSAAGLSFNHAAYLARMAAEDYDRPPPDGVFLRRELAVPIGNCSGATNDGNGRTTIPVIGFGCFFLLQPVGSNGNGPGGGGNSGGNSNDVGSNTEVYGQFLHSCTVGGTPGMSTGVAPGGTNSGPYIIQLYRDIRSSDS